jgi:predicted transposase/invertase (TIGR01784 family)
MRYLDPTNDVAFKRVFSDKAILMNFLNGILRLEEGHKIIDLDFVSTEEIPNIGQGKRSLFDIKVRNQAGYYYIVEMQNSSESGFLNRVQLYASHSYTSQILRGRIASLKNLTIGKPLPQEISYSFITD